MAASTARNASAAYCTGCGSFVNSATRSAIQRNPPDSVSRNGSSTSISSDSIVPLKYSIAPLKPF